MRKTKNSWSEAHIQYLKDNYQLKSNKEMAGALGVTEGSISTRLYKLGLKRERVFPVTTEGHRILHHTRKGGNTYARIRINGHLVHLHRYNYEQMHGKLPEGAVLLCIDGNTLNCEPSNWRVGTMEDRAHMNRGKENTRQTMKKLWAKVKLREAYGRPVTFTKLRSKRKATFTKGISTEPAKHITF